MAAPGPQRNRNVNKRTHCIVVDQDSLKLTRSKTKAIPEKGNLDKIIRHKEALGKIVKEFTLKYKAKRTNYKRE